MPFKDIQAFMKVLESKGQLKRITAEVDSDLEITEILIESLKKLDRHCYLKMLKALNILY